ncbi:MAG: aromatic amino acid transaminase [Pseudohongiellaceae bacterium]
MFQSLKALPADPILGLMATFHADDNPQKIDLGVGVYRDGAGDTPVMSAVKKAEDYILHSQQSKAYVGPFGSVPFNDACVRLILGAELQDQLGERCITIQVPGGCGGVRLGADFIKQANPNAKVWLGEPTWPNHVPLLASVGLEIATYPYYDHATHQVRFDEMMTSLAKAASTDVVLLHGCCHNPCGADLDAGQWQAVRDLALDKGFAVFIDLAYQGLGDGLNEDVYGLRLLAESLPELIVAGSCSKNFGLYRERTGTLTLTTASADSSRVAGTCLAAAARAMYSMPPDHGAAIVQHILNDDTLRAEWEHELTTMRDRINGLRRRLVQELKAAGINRDFSFIEREKGMFSFLGVSPEQVQRLMKEFSIYLVDSSRINVAGINDDNIAWLVKGLTAVLDE